MNLCIRDCEIEVYSSQLQRYVKRLQVARRLEQVPLDDLFNDDHVSRVSYEPCTDDLFEYQKMIDSFIEEAAFV